MRVALLLLLFFQSAGWDEPRDQPMGKRSGIHSFKGDLPLPYDPPLARQLTLILEASKPTYRMGEAVTVRLTVVNKTPAPVMCHCMLYTLKQFEPAIEIEYRLPGQPFRALHLTSREPCASCMKFDRAVSLYELLPGEYVRLTSEITKDFASGGTPFQEPGPYQLRAVLRDAEDKRPESTVVSDTVEVDVVASDAGPR